MGQPRRPARHDPAPHGARRRFRVVVTRSERQAVSLTAAVATLGCEVVLCPLIGIEPIAGGRVDGTAYDWVVVTSPNGAAQLAPRLAGVPRRIAAIGPGTAAELRAHGLEPDLVPAVSTQEGLLAELPRPAGHVLLAAAEGARRLLVDELDADFLPLYRTVELRPDAPPEATSSFSPRRRPLERSPPPGLGCRPSRSGRRPPRPRGSTGSRSSPRRRPTTFRASSPRSSACCRACSLTRRCGRS